MGGGPHTTREERTPTEARGLIEVLTFKVTNVVLRAPPPTGARHYLFIYATFNYGRETAKLIARRVIAARATGIRDAICMQILSRRDPARGRIRTVTNRDRARRARAQAMGRSPLTLLTRVSTPVSRRRPPRPSVSFFIVGDLSVLTSQSRFLLNY